MVEAQKLFSKTGLHFREEGVAFQKGQNRIAPNLTVRNDTMGLAAPFPFQLLYKRKTKHHMNL